MNKDNNFELIGKYATTLSIVEIGLGSFLHSLKIPFSGQFLSLNQVFILSKASIDIPNETKSPTLISTATALLKSLAPAGKKLTPMLAISAQGVLFNFGLFIFGNNFFGRVLGAILSSLWSYIQPLMIYMLIFGKDLIYMSDYYLNKIQKVFDITSSVLVNVILAIIATKILLSIVLVIISHKVSAQEFENYISWSAQFRTRQKAQRTTPLRGAIKDLLHPMMLLSLLLLTIFYLYSKSNHATMIWEILRPLTIAFILFYCLRVFPVEKLTRKMKEGKLKNVVEEALKNIQK